jgi:hypothetical protein
MMADDPATPRLPLTEAVMRQRAALDHFRQVSDTNSVFSIPARAVDLVTLTDALHSRPSKRAKVGRWMGLGLERGRQLEGNAYVV